MITLSLWFLLAVTSQTVSEYAIPDALVPLFRSNSAYEIVADINPFYLRGDFDGDKVMDYAVVIKARAGGKKGIAICHGNGSAMKVLGAGEKFVWDDNFGFDAWQVYGKRAVSRGPEEAKPPKLTGEAILVIWEEKATGLIYWDGIKYRWYHQDD
jgi:hypothetical protein